MNPSWDAAEQAARALEAAWPQGEPRLEEYWARYAPDRSLTVLASLIKVDIRCRFVRGERPAVDDYLKRFPELSALSDRVVSLIYEEYCLREERGEPLDPERFCDRYEPWRDSLESQLRYHRLLSQVAGKSPPRARFPEPGDRFQGFRLRSMLGQGGVARVFLAQDEELGDREVALKVSLDRGKEPSIMGRLDHPHIVPVLSVAHEPATGLRGLCMPYRSGLPLDKVLVQLGPASHPRQARALWDVVTPAGFRSGLDTRRLKGPGDGASADGTDERSGVLPPGWEGFPARGSYAEGVAWVILTLARALEHAHSRGILHLDVKPANVLLTRRDGPQLLDFNLAHDPHSADQAEVALRGGTLPYMAPEQLEAFLDSARWGDVGCTSDLYSLGLLLRELMTGRLPDVPDPQLSVPRAIREMLDLRARPGPSLRNLNPAVPHALDAIAERCLAFSPAQRYQRAGDLADDLDRFLTRRPLRHAPNTSKAEVVRNWSRRHPRLVAIAVVAIFATATLLTPQVLPRVLPIENHPEFRRVVSECQKEQFLDADRTVAHVVRMYPESALALVYQAIIREKLDDPVGAAKAFRQARKCKGAVEAFRRVLQDYPNTISLHMGLAISLTEARRWVEATREYVKVRDLDPQYYQAYQGLAHIADAHADDREGFFDLMEKAVHYALKRTPPIPDQDLADLYLSRALASVKWEVHPKARKPSDGRNLLQLASRDLHLAKSRSNSIRNDPRFLYCQGMINPRLADR